MITNNNDGPGRRQVPEGALIMTIIIVVILIMISLLLLLLSLL